MEKKVNAIVLRSADYRDADKLLTLFSLEEGTLSAGIRGVKKPGAKLRFAAQPFSFNEYILSETPSGRRTVVGASGLDGFYDLRTDLGRFYAAAAAAEFALAYLPEGVESPEFFFALCDLLKALAYGGAEPGTALAKFLAAGFSAAGFAATFGACGRCGREIEGKVCYDFDSAVGVCGACAAQGDVGMRPETYRFLGVVGDAEYAALPAAERDTVRRALRFFGYYSEMRAGVTLRSLGELAALYGGETEPPKRGAEEGGA